jgi:hypothetical protein
MEECFDNLRTIQIFLKKKILILKEKQSQKKNLLMLGKKDGILEKLPDDVFSEVYKLLYGIFPIPKIYGLTGCVHSLIL